jgi:predicted ATP-grasp superfamily ATP-dependent carboligase
VVIDSTVPVVVLYRPGDAAVAIARSLGRLGVPLHLVAQEGAPSPDWWSRHWAERVKWDFSRPEQESVSFLLDLGATIRARHGTRAILLTLADWIAIFIERNSDALREQFLFPQPERPVIRALLNKWEMHSLARDHDIPTPAAAHPTTSDEIDEFVARTGFPIVMKAAERFVAGRPPTKILHSRQQLMDALGDLDRGSAGWNVVLQEYIPGDVDTVWMCNGYFGADPGRAVTFTGRKLRQLPAGIATLAVCSPNGTVAAQTQRFMRGVGYRGCVGIGWRYDDRDGLYKLLDVNARVSGVFRLFEGTNEMDVARLCYLDLTGQELPATELRPGRRWMREEDFSVAAASVRSGQLTVRGWARSIRGVRERHWLVVDDPLPFFARSHDALRRRVRRNHEPVAAGRARERRRASSS